MSHHTPETSPLSQFLGRTWGGGLFDRRIHELEAAFEAVTVERDALAIRVSDLVERLEARSRGQSATLVNDRDFIEQLFCEGMREAEHDCRLEWPPALCPHEKTSLAGHWWTRGYAYEARNLLRMEALRKMLLLQAQIEAIRSLAAALDPGRPRRRLSSYDEGAQDARLRIAEQLEQILAAATRAVVPGDPTTT